MIKGRDSRGHFIKGNVPWNKRLDSTQRGITFTCTFCRKQKPIEEMMSVTRFFPPLIACGDCWKLLDRGTTGQSSLKEYDCAKSGRYKNY